MHIVRRTWLPPTYVCCESFGTRSRMIQLSQQHKHAKHFSARWWPRLARARANARVRRTLKQRRNRVISASHVQALLSAPSTTDYPLFTCQASRWYDISPSRFPSEQLLR